MAMSEKFDIYIQCGICLSNYSEPRILSCIHKFCTPCLETLIEGKTKFKCPLCRTDVLVPANGVVGFESYQNVLVSNLETPSNECGTFCQICDIRSYAVVKCLNCKQYLCKTCHEYHKKISLLQDHQYENLRQIESNEMKTERNEDNCNFHRKELTLFCKPCNECICNECQIHSHKRHEVETISKIATMERNLLNATISGLKARIPILENTVQTGKTEKTIYFKNRQKKEEIKAHSASLKEVFCKTVDIVTNTNLDAVDKFTTDIKVIEAFIEETETDKTSLLSMVKTTEELITSSSDRNIMRICTNLKRVFIRTLQTSPKVLKLYDLDYTPKILNKQLIHDVAGSVKIVEREVKPLFRNLPIPDIRIVKEFKQISSIGISGALDLVSNKNATCWILNSNWNTPLLFSVDGSRNTNCNTKVKVENKSRLLKKTDGEVFVWSKISAVRITPNKQADQDQNFQVDFENGIAVCFLQNGNLFLYNPDKKIFIEVGEHGGIKREVQPNLMLAGMLKDEPLRAVQTKAGNLLIVQTTDTVITINDKGDIVNTASVPNASLRNICIDKYQNIFVTDYSNNNICLFSPEGEYLENLCSIRNPNYVTVDDIGNIWISNGKKIEIYSYL